MALRSLLTVAERGQILAIPTTSTDLAASYTLSDADMSLVRQHRGDTNRLGFAIQLCVLRFPGVALGADTEVPPELVSWLADRLAISSAAWCEYGTGIPLDGVQPEARPPGAFEQSDALAEHPLHLGPALCRGAGPRPVLQPGCRCPACRVRGDFLGRGLGQAVPELPGPPGSARPARPGRRLSIRRGRRSAPRDARAASPRRPRRRVRGSHRSGHRCRRR